jgi:hypothetical protein
LAEQKFAHHEGTSRLRKSEKLPEFGTLKITSGQELSISTGANGKRGGKLPPSAPENLLLRAASFRT